MIRKPRMTDKVNWEGRTTSGLELAVLLMTAVLTRRVYLLRLKKPSMI